MSRHFGMSPFTAVVWLSLMGVSHGATTPAPTFLPTPLPTPLPTITMNPTVTPQPTTSSVPSTAPSMMPSRNCVPWREGCPLWGGMSGGSATTALVQAIVLIVLLVSLTAFCCVFFLLHLKRPTCLNFFMFCLFSSADLRGPCHGLRQLSQ